MNKENVVCVYTYIQWNISHEKNKTMPFAAPQRSLEIITKREVSQNEKKNVL